MTAAISRSLTFIASMLGQMGRRRRRRPIHFFSPFVLRYTCAVIAKWHQIELNIEGRTSFNPARQKRYIDKQKIKTNQKSLMYFNNRDKLRQNTIYALMEFSWAVITCHELDSRAGGHIFKGVKLWKFA